MTRVEFAIAALVGCALACAEPPPSVDGGYDPNVGDCCWLIIHGKDAVTACVRDLTDRGQCRWLTCLGGAVVFEVCR